MRSKRIIFILVEDAVDPIDIEIDAPTIVAMILIPLQEEGATTPIYYLYHITLAVYMVITHATIIKIMKYFYY